jgi:hypothetical protein
MYQLSALGGSPLNQAAEFDAETLLAPYQSRFFLAICRAFLAVSDISSRPVARFVTCCVAGIIIARRSGEVVPFCGNGREARV